MTYLDNKGRCLQFYFYILQYSNIWESFCGVVANVLDCNIVVSEFELQSHSHAHFMTNNIRQSWNILFPTSAMGEIAPQLFFCKNDFGTK